ncbi:hypothetical protein [Halorussus aquaticus]|uniref:MazG nucleotide pyrophosphohydrolase domain-containing protein n=1 Tax=Halorussus aquaticus TaxID=2953748 RepID=A0ABD5Q543_9EURY|nr:hypothetical protein [Halorussus aquaticus]
MNEVLPRIRELWGDEDDFQEGGFEYVTFVIENDIRDMAADDWDEDECIEEMADIAINALRALDELGDEAPSDAIMQRLGDRMEGEVDEIIDEYRTMYENRDERERTLVDR